MNSQPPPPPPPPAVSPAMSDFSNMDDDELDLYLAGCMPLSNLPTPPSRVLHPHPHPHAPLQHPIQQHRHQHQHHHLHLQHPPAPPALCTPTLQTPPPEPDVQQRFSELQVYASHLVDLIPGANDEPNVVEIVEGFLQRASLPVQICAFAACLLAMLEDPPEGSERVLTILAALSLAHGFLDDRGRSNHHWAVVEAAGRFQAQDVQRAKMAILDDIDFGLVRVSEAAVLAMVRDMRRRLPAPLVSISCDDGTVADDGDNEGAKNMMSTSASGHAVWAFGVQTPEPSP